MKPASAAVIDRVKRNLVGLKMPRALEVLDVALRGIERGETTALDAIDILLAEDTAGSGHSWRLTDDQPWRRAYVVLQPGAAVPFRASKPQSVSE